MDTIRVYSIFDSKAIAFLQPFFCVNNAVAIRNFTKAVQDERSDFHRFAPDYTLFCIGEWDQFTGEFKNLEAKEALGVAVQYLNVEAK